jgi:hypothetical protein
VKMPSKALSRRIRCHQLAIDEAPDGTIELSGASVAVGIGYTWGKGTLRYAGRSIPVTFKGLSLAAVGGESIRASGDVYHLTKLENFEGNYTPASAGATVAGGGSVAAMENQNGVVIKLRSANQGWSSTFRSKAWRSRIESRPCRIQSGWPFGFCATLSAKPRRDSS